MAGPCKAPTRGLELVVLFGEMIEHSGGGKAVGCWEKVSVPAPALCFLSSEEEERKSHHQPQLLQTDSATKTSPPWTVYL